MDRLKFSCEFLCVINHVIERTNITRNVMVNVMLYGLLQFSMKLKTFIFTVLPQYEHLLVVLFYSVIFVIGKCTVCILIFYNYFFQNEIVKFFFFSKSLSWRIQLILFLYSH